MRKRRCGLELRRERGVFGKIVFYKVLKKKEISDKMRGHEYAMMVYAVNG